MMVQRVISQPLHPITQRDDHLSPIVDRS